MPTATSLWSIDLSLTSSGSNSNNALADSLPQFSGNFWLKWTSSQTNMGIFIKGETASPGWLFYTDDHGGGFQFQIIYNDLQEYNVQCRGAHNDGLWHSIAFTYDQNSAGLIYVDGVLQTLLHDFLPSPLVQGFNATQPFVMGVGIEDNPALFSLDEVALWNRVLSVDEVRALAAGNSPSSSGLLSYWRIEEGSGLVLNDSSGNGNTVTFNDITWDSSVPPPFWQPTYRSSSMNLVF